MVTAFPSSGASAVHLETARRVLALEEAAGADAVAAPVAARVYDKLVEHLSALLGDTGVQLLFARSAKMVQGEFAHLAGASILEGSTKLRECLAARDPALTRESATALFGTFYALLTTFIGERLTTQVLRRAWPTI